jgi:putative ABC transport system permease protein
MPDRRSINRSMFWRVLRRSVFANRGRLFVILLALGAGAAITAALLNLQVDAKRRITTEFRSFGANVTIAPRGAEQGSTMPESVAANIPSETSAGQISKVSILSAIVQVTPYVYDHEHDAPGYLSKPFLAVVDGEHSENGAFSEVFPFKLIYDGGVSVDAYDCQLGERIGRRFGGHEEGFFRLKVGESWETCTAADVRSFGNALDDQIFVPLDVLRRLTGKSGQIGLVQLHVPGTPSQIAQTIEMLQKKLPDVDVRPIRQFTEGEAHLYNRISGILTATVAVVLILTALCVMAAMTNVAMERKNDVGLMKAIGGSVRRVLRLFLAEAALLGLAGGLIGAAIGIVISMGLGKAVFGVAAQPRLIVYPISVALTIIVAILAAYPLRRLVHVRPASVFRGEE